MLYLVGIPNCWFSHAAAYITLSVLLVGFTSSYVNLTLPYILFYNQDGFLPDIKITHKFNGSRPVSTLRFRKCQRNDFGGAQQFTTDELDMSTIFLTHDEVGFDKFGVKCYQNT